MVKRLNAKLLRINRVVAWILLVIGIVYFSTGFSMVGRFGFNKLINVSLATTIHDNFCIPFITLFLIHVGINVYFALKRWKLIR